ncbi:hypothetical protein HanPSC8_Chr10g0432991 [Helianthus annuus]|nr:hypothetical protein HanPSC8_Chr10g0432991 [Helianthus annuus]
MATSLPSFLHVWSFNKRPLTRTVSPTRLSPIPLTQKLSWVIIFFTKSVEAVFSC